MKNNLPAILAIFVLSGVILTGGISAAIQPILASSEQETGSEDEPQDQTGEGGAGSEGSDESETSETEEGNDEGVENSPNDETSDEQQQQQEAEIDETTDEQQQETGLENDEIGEGAVPCPNSVEVDSIPEGCSPPTDETTRNDMPDTVPTTQTPSIPNPENTGVGQPRPPYKGDSLLGPRSSELPTTPDSILSQWSPDTRFGVNLGTMSDVPNSVPTPGVLEPGKQEELLPETPEPGTDYPTLTKFKETDCAPWDGDCCNNNIDDDKDGYSDENDKDCNGQFNKGKEVCGDSADNDEDGYTDSQDPDCIPPFAPTGKQQDSSDRSMPFTTPLNPSKTLDASRLQVMGSEICNDGTDNDGDGLVDSHDIDCNPLR
jgi:hypothetical protein